MSSVDFRSVYARRCRFPESREALKGSMGPFPKRGPTTRTRPLETVDLSFRTSMSPAHNIPNFTALMSVHSC